VLRLAIALNSSELMGGYINYLQQENGTTDCGRADDTATHHQSGGVACGN